MRLIIVLSLAILHSGYVSAAENRLRTSRSSASVQRSRLVDSDAAAIPSSGVRQASHRSTSMVARAASGSIPSQIPEAPLDGTLVQGKVQQSGHVQQVGFFDACPNGCGAVCDCDGISYGDPGCGIEASCGFEPGCGIGHAMEMFGNNNGCGEAVCGVETMYGDPGCGFESDGCCGTADCGCDSCGGCSVDRIPFFLPLLRVQWCRFDFFAGVQGFKGPMNFASTSATDPAVRSGSGSFGFYQGFNEGRSLKRWLGWDMAAQLGLRATQSNLSGAEFTDETRRQIFVTAGLFRRVDYGLQYGGVIDYFNDDWWFQSDLTQFRGELSWKTQGCHVFGLQTMLDMGSENSATTVRQANGTVFNSTVNFEPTDQYRLFYKRLLNRSGDWSAFAGWTESDDGLLGASMNLPLRQKLVFSTSATFLIPREGNLSGGHQEESWNLSMGLIYRPGGPTGCGRYCRPMFDVADNGTFLVDQN